MENYTKIKIKNHILKIVGVFPINSEFEQKAILSGYEIHQFAPTSLPFYKDYFYKGFRNLYTLNGENNKVRRLTKKPGQGLTLLAENKEIKISINQVDLFLFPDSFGMFSLDLKVEFNEQSSQLAQFSDACFVVREFERGLIQGTDLNRMYSPTGNCDIQRRKCTKRRIQKTIGRKFSVFSISKLERNGLVRFLCYRWE